MMLGCRYATEAKHVLVRCLVKFLMKEYSVCHLSPNEKQDSSMLLSSLYFKKASLYYPPLLYITFMRKS